MDSTNHSLLLAFDTDAPDYARGFEAGALWAELRSDEEVEAIVHAANTEMLLRMGESLGRETVGEIIDETWTRVTFSPPRAVTGLSPESGHL